MRRCITSLIVLGALALNLLAVGATSAAPMDMDDCSHDATIAALRECVEHAAHHGHVDNPGIAASLLAKLDAAQALAAAGQPTAAGRVLTALIQELAAQDGKHVAAPHAGHLIAHAETVIAALLP